MSGTKFSPPKDYKVPAVWFPAVETVRLRTHAEPGQPADPCPQCIPGGTCSALDCGRKRSSELMGLYGITKGSQ